MLEDAVMPAASIAERDRQDAASILDLAWPAQDGVLGDLVAEGSAAAVVFTEEVADSTAEEVAVAFTEVVEEVTVGKR
jgi:hypothetical protein